MELLVRVPGSCGELLQGWDERGEPFLLTAPIDRYAAVTIRDDGRRARHIGAKGLAALQAVLAFLHVADYPYSLYQTESLPQGKGMASSSADIGAVIVGVAKSLGHTLSGQDMAALAASIEPTDGVFCQGLCQLNYLTGTIHHIYPVVPALRMAIVDTGGTIDTVAFHDRSQEAASKRPVSRGLRLLQGQPWSAETLARAATYSALDNQEFLYKEAVPKLVPLLAKLGALGLNAAHSGTVIGILFPEDVAVPVIERTVTQALARLGTTAQYRETVLLRSGGYTVTYR